jgi:Protein of unknown function (DUF2849)
MSEKIVTANRLDDGLVIYFAGEQGWVNGLEGAVIAANEAEGDLLLKAAHAPIWAGLVVDPYLIDISRDLNNSPVPTRQRERIRLQGPTVRPDLGKHVWGNGGHQKPSPQG